MANDTGDNTLDSRAVARQGEEYRERIADLQRDIDAANKWGEYEHKCYMDTLQQLTEAEGQLKERLRIVLQGVTINGQTLKIDGIELLSPKDADGEPQGE